jgi:hypothetical protein
MARKNIIGCKFSVQNDWLINCKFAARPGFIGTDTLRQNKVMQLKSVPNVFGINFANEVQKNYRGW